MLFFNFNLCHTSFSLKLYYKVLLLLLALSVLSCQFTTKNKKSDLSKNSEYASKNESLSNKSEIRDSINKKIISNGIFKELKLVKVIQNLNPSLLDSVNNYEPTINSPKSAIFSVDGSKFYINSLEGHATIVFDSKTYKRLKVINHEFTKKNAFLFKDNESTVFDYKFKQVKSDYNFFLGKPVESCISHEGRFLWVTYYRRNWDLNAESPSAIAIIDTQKDEIIRVMPSGPLPKMIACSPNKKWIAVTHWGDNTVGLIDISSDNPFDFSFVSHITIDERLSMNFSVNTDRDSNCGNCLRGTVFTPDNSKLLIAKMGGNGIAVVDVAQKKYIGTITGSQLNLRHLIINNGNLISSSNKFGVVQKANLNDIFLTEINDQNQIYYPKWVSLNVGLGARTIEITDDGKYIFVCVNNESKVVIMDAVTMSKVGEVSAAPFPVGMALSPDGSQLIVTSQGKSGIPKSGNTVMAFKVIYEK